MYSKIDEDYIYLLSLPIIKKHGISQFKLLSRGSINRNWRVNTKIGEDWVVRKNSDGIAGVNRYAEKRILQKIAPLHISPRVIEVNPDQGYLITEYIDAPVWKKIDCLEPLLQKKIAGVMQRIHTIGCDEPSTHISARIEQYLSPVSIFQRKKYKPVIMELLEQARQLGFLKCQSLCHWDMHHTNIIGYDSVMLIDWEFSGMANRVLDSAVFSLYHGFNDEQCEYFDNMLGIKPDLSVVVMKLVSQLFNLWNLSVKA